MPAAGTKEICRKTCCTAAALLLLGWALLILGCGPVQYSIEISSAERVLEQAREEQAQRGAPWEYFYAEAHLEKAREEAAQASYEDAMRYANTAKKFGNIALEISRRQHADRRP